MKRPRPLMSLSAAKVVKRRKAKLAQRRKAKKKASKIVVKSDAQLLRERVMAERKAWNARIDEALENKDVRLLEGMHMPFWANRKDVSRRLEAMKAILS
jgi:hypothetical protein